VEYIQLIAVDVSSTVEFDVPVPEKFQFGHIYEKLLLKSSTTSLLLILCGTCSWALPC